MRLCRLVVLLATPILGLAAGCEETGPNAIAGTYTATTFVFTNVGEPPVDVLALGGDLTITIASTNATFGTLAMPAELTGGSDVTVSMAGTAVRSGNTVQFEQSADSFVRDVTWTIVGKTLQGSLTSPAGVTVDVTLTRSGVEY